VTIEITGDQHSIYFLRAGDFRDLIKDVALLVRQVRLVENAPKVPIGGVEESHNGLRFDDYRRVTITLKRLPSRSSISSMCG
jgi:hypothetical protein